MSVEQKIREFLQGTTVAEAYPGFGSNRDAEAPMQGSSQKPQVNNLDKGAGADAAMKAAKATSLAAGSGPMDKKNPTQGSSNANPEHDDLGTDMPGKVASSKMSKTTKHPMGKGAGQAKTTTASVDPSTVVNQPNSKGNVYREDVEIEEGDDFITEDEFETLSPEEQSEYEMVEFDSELEEAKKEEECEDCEDDDEDEDEDDMKKKKMMMKKDMMKKGMMKKEDVDSRVDLSALFEGDEHLSEEFKTRAASLFEAVVTARVSELREEIENSASEAAAEIIFENQQEMVEKVDAYLNYVVEQWLEQNQVEVVNGLRNEVTEDFINGLRNLFAENYIEVPEERYDVLGEMQEQIEELQTALNEQIDNSISLNEELITIKRDSIISYVCEDLAQTEIEKFKSLVEDVTFEDESSYIEKLSVIKGNYFPNAQAVSLVTDSDDISEELEVSPNVQKYVEALSKTSFSK
jgi:hypothetical protein